MSAIGGSTSAPICEIYAVHGIVGTEVLAASIRDVNRVSRSFHNGAGIVTMPPSVFAKMYDHVLTEKGLNIFDEDSKYIKA